MKHASFSHATFMPKSPFFRGGICLGFLVLRHRRKFKCLGGTLPFRYSGGHLTIGFNNCFTVIIVGIVLALPYAGTVHALLIFVPCFFKDILIKRN
jgi:hypothetical protein